MRLRAGDVAPFFAATDIDGGHHELDALRGAKSLVSFYRYAACPLCNLRMHELSEQRWWQDGRLRGLAFFQSPAESLRSHREDRTLPFPLIADPEHEVYEKYGVESSWAAFAVAFIHPRSVTALAKGFLPGRMEGDKTLVPADFLIDEDLKIHTAYYGSNIGDHLPIAAIREFLNS